MLKCIHNHHKSRSSVISTDMGDRSRYTVLVCNQMLGQLSLLPSLGWEVSTEHETVLWLGRYPQVWCHPGDASTTVVYPCTGSTVSKRTPAMLLHEYGTLLPFLLLFCYESCREQRVSFLSYAMHSLILPSVH